jgi:plasmid stabilization system protein ParE
VSYVIITEGAAEGLERCRSFLVENNHLAAIRAAQTIAHFLTLLEKEPEIGRPLEDLTELRELMIPFGSSGYVALYHYDASLNSVYLLAFRHQKEAGY